MKKIFFITLFLFSALLYAQDKVQIYDPLADARHDLQQAIQQAGQENKHVMVQVGGNWCPWCVKLHGFFESEPVIDSIMRADYVLAKINFSKENKNPETMALLGYPQRFGFPVLVVLDAEGNRLHTQNTAYLEQDKGYDVEKVKGFLLDWNRTAINPATYQK
jgi:thiol:disulfide interchange protein